MGGLRLNRLTIGTEQHGGHQTQGTKPLGHNITLHIPVIVLTGPDKPTMTFDHLGHLVIDESVGVGELVGIKFSLVLGLVQVLKSLQKQTIVLLQNRILGRKHQRQFTLKRIAKTALGKPSNALYGVVHTQGHPTIPGKLVHLQYLLWFGCIGWGVNHLQLTRG